MDVGTDVSFQRSLIGWRPTIFAIALVALACKLALAWCTVGTSDMRTWEADPHVIRTEGGAALYEWLERYPP